MSEQRAVLDQALTELSDLAPEETQDGLRQLRRQLAEDRFRVLIAGEAKRGKSTFVNALLGREVLPTGVTPLTAVATTVTYGHPERVDVDFADGHSARYALSEVAEFVTEARNPANERRVAHVLVSVDAPLLAAGVELVDTPGTGSVYEHNTLAAQEALETMDAAVFVLTSDPPISAGERDLLRQVAASAVAAFVVLNKADRLDEAELAEAVEFTGSVIRDVLDGEQLVYAISARRGVAGPGGDGASWDGGFLADFQHYLSTRRSVDLQRSLARRGAAIAEIMLDEVRMTQRADALWSAQEQDRIADFRARLAESRTRMRESCDLAWAQSRHLLADLNADADRASTELVDTAQDRLLHLLDSEFAEADLKSIDTLARDRAITTVTDLAESWRHQRARWLQEGLQDLQRRLSAALRREREAVREAARELLGVDLSVAGREIELVSDPRFHYVPTAQAGDEPALSGFTRRHLPGRKGRQRSVDRILREVGDLVPQRIGRARGDLQQRLQESTRLLVAELQRQHTDIRDTLERALDAAEVLHTASEDERGTRRQCIAARENAANTVLRTLDPLRTDPAQAS